LPMLKFGLHPVFCCEPSLVPAVMIKEKIVEDFGQPSFHVGAGVELFVGGESANKSLLDQVVGIGWTF